MSFQQGLSGLNASSKTLEIIGNNIANANTVGAKASRAEFADMYAASLSGTGSSTIGIGAQLAAVAQQFTQGNISATANPMDLAINGRGFFMLQDPSGKQVYSRNGQFKIDRDGYIVNNQGQRLLAKAWDESVSRAVGDPVAVQVSAGGGDAVKTGEGLSPDDKGVQVTMNFDATTPVVANRTPFSLDNAASYDYSTSHKVYDGLGRPLNMTYYFRKDADNAWSIYGSVDGLQFDPTTGEVSDPALGAVPAAVPLATVTFGDDGHLASVTDAGGNALAVGEKLKFSVNDPRLLTDDTGAPIGQTALFTDLPFDLGDSTQYGANFSVSDLRQDGFAPGDLVGVGFDAGGVLKASYSNGRYVNLAQLQLADFANVQGLKPLGGNAWEQTFASGPAVVNSPGDNSMGLVQAGALEESNVDLTAELVNMITAQRIYQANAQTIKTIDQVMQTLVNLR